jgi:hypothetical protein
MKRPHVLLCLALGLTLPATAFAADAAPRFEVERDWSGELRPRYKGPQPEEPVSAPVVAPETPRVVRKVAPAPKIEVWDEAEERPRARDDRPRERESAARERNTERAWRERQWAARERAEREWEEREEREWRERERAERAWREEERIEREMARRERYSRRSRRVEPYDCDDDYC